MADYQENLESLTDRGINVVALSVDAREDARTIVEDLGLTFPVLYGLDYRSVADEIGAYYEDERAILHATNFLLRGDEIVQVTYSSGPIGRMQSKNVLSLVEYFQKQEE